jgi:hypothetical protein
MAENIQVLDPYHMKMVDPDMSNPAHRIAVEAQKAALDNSPTTALDAENPDDVVGPVLTSGVEVAPPSALGPMGEVPGQPATPDEVENEKSKGKK